MKCNRCGKWAGAHAYLPGQPKDDLCMCPLQRTWVGLTDEERLEAAEIDGADEWFWKVCKAIEAKLKEKNGFAKDKNK